MTKERRLGRGLEALLGKLSGTPEGAGDGALGELPHDAAPAIEAEVSASAAAGSAATSSARLAIASIEKNPFQPRREFDEAEIAALAETLKSVGMLQPVVVRHTADGKYQLVAGERRLRAAGKAGWTDVPVQMVEADDRQVAEIAIIENLHRKDLNPLEKAASFNRYIGEYKCTQEELSKRLGLDRSTIANLIRLLELPAAVQDALRSGQITQGHARALLPLGDEHEQIAFCEQIHREGMSVRATEAAVQEKIDCEDREPLAVVGGSTETGKRVVRGGRGRSQSEHLAALEQEFRSALGMKVALRQTARGRGKLIIQFRSHEEFDRLRATICDSQPRKQSRAG